MNQAIAKTVNRRAKSSNQIIFGTSASIFIVVILAANILTFGAAMGLGSPQYLYLSVAMLSSTIPLAAGVLRRDGFDPFEPINLAAAAIFFGTTARAFWLLASESSRVEFIMMGTDFVEISQNAPSILLSIVMFTLGYVLCNFRVPLERFRAIRDYSFNVRKTYITLIATAIASVFGIILILQNFDIRLSGGFISMSAKRVHEFVTEEGEIVYGSGTERFVGLIAQHGFVFLAGLIISRCLPLNQRNIILLLSLGALGILTPYITSSRSSIVLIAIHTVIILHYYGRLRLTGLLIGFIGAFFLLATLGVIREANTIDQRRDMTAVDRVLGSGNSLDFVRTSAIMDRVPEVVPFQQGMTYVALFAAPIPRSMWLDKPQVGLGAFVKGEIFGENTRLSGWPSGMIAEGWINFGFIGLIIPMFIFGGMLRVFYETCKPFLGISLPVTLIYAVSIWRLGFGTIGMNFAHGITQTLAYFFPMLIILILARQRLSS
jgi:hypothetical protein